MISVETYPIAMEHLFEKGSFVYETKSLHQANCFTLHLKSVQCLSMVE